jgi:cathepsin D
MGLYRFLNVSTAQTLEPGGSFSMGFTNSSLYTGDIDYVALEGEPAYWTVPLSGQSCARQDLRVEVDLCVEFRYHCPE